MPEQEGMPKFGVDPDYAKKIREKVMLEPSSENKPNKKKDFIKIEPGKPKEIIVNKLNEKEENINKIDLLEEKKQ